MPAPATGPQVLRAGRLRWVAIGAACLAFAGAGVYLAVEGEGRGFAVAGFFGLATLLCAAMVVYGHADLRLAEDGFVLGLVWRDRGYRWQEVSPFTVVAIRGHRRVAFDVPKDRGIFASMARRQAGFSTILPYGYGMKAEELAELMNDWRSHALAGGGGR